ncbi:hypothetical protein Rsub_05452 [Raphidocelis subcapitata]|uniref:Uncharacterized protein n=1 Tax=Raphidocelis subcapitata TaxID=307507 RepID=A0A2V0P4P6_9CHLO|nr:hypothetical protein Rsub_05452 [Raphidocelis subcapitata]|eukprot:GBF92833.1 hypothetical protein Rsub_05452 [Raphidocelis subcapitata]
MKRAGRRLFELAAEAWGCHAPAAQPQPLALAARSGGVASQPNHYKQQQQQQLCLQARRRVCTQPQQQQQQQQPAGWGGAWRPQPPGARCSWGPAAALPLPPQRPAWAGLQLQARACKHGSAYARNKKSIADNGLYLGAVVLGMIGLSYASVPLYQMFCQATGYGGALGQAKGVEEKLRRRAESPDAELEAKAAARELRVWFSSDVADDLPWRFTPTQDFVKVRPGESTLVFFTAENRSDKAITGVSTYNVVPEKAALYFNKIQCFCFEEQRLRPGETVDMPVFFYLDPELAGDHNCRNIHDITLSYTFYKVDDEDASNLDDSSPVRVHTWTSGPLPAGVTLAPGTVLPPGVGVAAAVEGEAAAAEGAATAAAAEGAVAAAAPAAKAG